MPLIIYQVGTVPVFFAMEGVDNSGVEVDANTSWVAKSTELHGVSHPHFFTNPGNPITTPRSINITGNLASSDHHNADENLQALQAMGGLPNVPIIGFYYEDRFDIDLKNPYNCPEDLIWIHTRGIITNVDKSSEWNISDRPFSLAIQEIDLTIQLQSFWEGLNSWEWEYRNDPQHTINPLNTTLDSVTGRFKHPRRFSELDRDGYFFKWGLELSELNPTFWNEMFEEERFGGFGIDYSSPGVFDLYINPKQWSAPPLSVYAFRGLDATSTLEVKVKKQINPVTLDTEEETATLDLSVVDNQLIGLGYSGLTPDDVIITGGITPYPGFIIRDEEQLLDVRPKWVYDGLYPGRLFIGHNQIIVSVDGANGEVAFLHKYRIY